MAARDLWVFAGKPGYLTSIESQHKKYENAYKHIRVNAPKRDNSVTTKLGKQFKAAALIRFAELITKQKFSNTVEPASIAAEDTSLYQDIVSLLEMTGADEGLTSDVSLQTSLATLSILNPFRIGSHDGKTDKETLVLYRRAYVDACRKNALELEKVSFDLERNELIGQLHAYQIAFFGASLALVEASRNVNEKSPSEIISGSHTDLV